MNPSATGIESDARNQVIRGLGREDASLLRIGILERAGLISHTRGRTRIENREGLEKVACECYHTIRGRQKAVLG